jgi:hypothetical protein
VEGNLATELVTAYLSDQLEGSSAAGGIASAPGGFGHATSSVSELAAVLQRHAPAYFRDQDRQFFQVSVLQHTLYMLYTLDMVGFVCEGVEWLTLRNCTITDQDRQLFPVNPGCVYFADGGGHLVSVCSHVAGTATSCSCFCC